MRRVENDASRMACMLHYHILSQQYYIALCLGRGWLSQITWIFVNRYISILGILLECKLRSEASSAAVIHPLHHRCDCIWPPATNAGALNESNST